MEHWRSIERIHRRPAIAILGSNGARPASVVGSTSRFNLDHFRAGVAVAPVYGVHEQVEDTHFWSRDLFKIVSVPGIGELLIYGTPWRLTGTPVNALRGAPNLGEHTREILTDLLDLSSREIDRLEASGILT